MNCTPHRYHSPRARRCTNALAGLVATWPDYDFTVNALYADANLFTAEWTMTGTLGQNFPVGNRIAVPDGRQISFEGVDICPVVDGKVTVKSSYVDAIAWYEQLTFQEARGIHPRLLPRHRDVEFVLGRDQVIVVIFTDVDLHPVDRAGELVAVGAVVR